MRMRNGNDRIQDKIYDLMVEQHYHNYRFKRKGKLVRFLVNFCPTLFMIIVLLACLFAGKKYADYNIDQHRQPYQRMNTNIYQKPLDIPWDNSSFNNICLKGAAHDQAG